MADPNQAFYDSVPPEVPRTHSPIFTWCCRLIFRKLGWSFKGEVPPERKVITVIAPHTSNLDFILLVIAKYALRLGSSYIMKKEAFFWPFKNLFISLGGVPIDRSQPTKIVAQVTKEIRKRESMWIAITPEGTRKKVKKYKSGFSRMAYSADIPIVIIAFNYKEKTLTFDKSFRVGSDHEKEADDLRNYIREKFVGRFPEQQ